METRTRNVNPGIMALAERLDETVYRGRTDKRFIIRVCNKGYFTEYDNPNEWKNTFKGAFLAKYPQYTTVMNMIEDALGCRNPEWTMFTKRNLQEIADTIKSRVCAKTAVLYTSVIKSLLNDWKEESHVELPTSNFKDSLKVKKEPSYGVFLTEAEIDKIRNYKAEDEIEETVKSQFLCEYYLGGRRSDMLLINHEMIDKKACTITYVSQKTKTKITVPLHDNFLKYFVKSKSIDVCYSRYQKTLKDICRKAGITDMVSVFLAGKQISDEKWKFVGSHTARRSYACNLYSRGCDIYTISKRMGHSSVSVTETYIVCGERDLPELVRDWVHS